MVPYGGLEERMMISLIFTGFVFNLTIFVSRESKISFMKEKVEEFFNRPFSSCLDGNLRTVLLFTKSIRLI